MTWSVVLIRNDVLVLRLTGAPPVQEQLVQPHARLPEIYDSLYDSLHDSLHDSLYDSLNDSLVTAYLAGDVAQVAAGGGEVTGVKVPAA